MRLRNLIFISIFLTYTACDCQYHISGIVLDEITKKPIHNVAIGKTDTTDLDNPFNRKTFTMVDGNYEVKGIAGTCNEVKMFFTKEGYQTQKITFPNNSNDTIFLKPTLKQVSNKENTLSVINAHSMVYNSSEERVYLFGGADEKEVKSDLWFLNKNDWKKISVTISPEARTFAPMVYDKNNKRIVLFGGSKVLFGKETRAENLLNDTWQFKDSKWSKIETKNAPIPRAEANMVYDENKQRIVLFGGYTINNGDYIKLGDTWEFYYNDWHLISKTGPSARHGVSMAYDNKNDYIILFGGSTVDKQYGESSGETWILKNKQWQKLETKQPVGVFNASMVYDKLNDQFIRFGGWNGNTRINDTWVLNNNKWELLPTKNQPISRNHSSMVYDEKRKKIMLYGGHDGNNVFGDLWEFDKNGWNNVYKTKPIERIKNGH